VKMLMICCESGLDLKVVETLDELQVPGYTVCKGSTGKGVTGRKQDSPVWPGSNVIVHTCVSDELIPTIVERVRGARNDYVKQPGCKVFAVPVEQLL
jgi:hypothetical protein